MAGAGDLPAAVEAFRKAVALDDRNHQAWANLGAALKGLAPPSERAACYRRALAITENAYTRANLAAALIEAFEVPQAIIEAQTATTAMPDFLPGWVNLGNALRLNGESVGAQQAYRRALALDPDNVDALHGLGCLFAVSQHHEEAIPLLGRAQALRPDDHGIGSMAARARQQGADWSRHAEDCASLARWVDQGRPDIPPFNLLSVPGFSGQRQKANAAVHAAHEFRELLPGAGQFPPSALRSGTRLRVGYLTADLRTHVIGRLMGPVFQQDDARSHDIVIYDLWAGANPLKESLVPHVSAWKNISGLGLREAAALIAADRMDILVDMTGYTAHGRTAIMACRPAPVQVNFLGYPGTLGDRRLADYILTDAVTSPLTHADDYAEALAWLPTSLLPPTAFDYPLPDRSRADLGLPAGGVVLAAFHGGYKINPGIFADWMAVLKGVPDAVLWLLAATPQMRERLLTAARGHGVAPDRLVFFAGGSYAEYLAALSRADLFLDTQPYTAGGTARDALMVGVPMVTALGDTFAGRMAASACVSEGVPECVASAGDYVPLAIALATDPDRRHVLRDRLHAARATAPDRVRRFAGDLDRLYHSMAARHAAGLPPTHLSASPPSGDSAPMSPSLPQAKTVLHVGCGPATKDKLPAPLRGNDWREIRYDIDPAIKPDIVGSMTDMSMIADGSLDAVYSSHNIEHLFAHEVPVALAEFARVLKPRGFAIVACPDLQALGPILAEGRLVETLYESSAGPITALDILYGFRRDLQAGNHYMAHKIGFSGPLLLNTMKDSGFAAVTGIRNPDAYEIWAIGFRWEASEDEMNAIRREYLGA